MLSSAELRFAGPREPGGVAVGHQRAPPARQGSCHETREAPWPQAKPTRGRPDLGRSHAVLGLPVTWPHASDNAAFPPGALGPAGSPPAPPPGQPPSRIPLLWPPD